jgi:hypothetical protein
MRLGAPWSLRMRTPFPERSQARPEETLKPSVEAKIFFVPSALNSRIAWLLAQGDWWSFPFFSLSASRYFGDKETSCLYWPLGTVIIAGPKVLDFYAGFCAHRATCLKADGKDIKVLNLILSGDSDGVSNCT